jgi:hypothetical protein
MLPHRRKSETIVSLRQAYSPIQPEFNNFFSKVGEEIRACR